MTYQFAVEISGEFDDVIDRTVAALKEEGFGVLMDLDIQATLKEKLGVDKSAYRILGACNPPLANQALDTDLDMACCFPAM